MHKKIMDAIIKELHIKKCLRDIAQYWGFRSTVPGPDRLGRWTGLEDKG